MSYLALLVCLLPSPRVVTDAQLAPISLGARDSTARALMARGRWKAAAKHVTASAPEARFARGWLLQKGGDAAGAVSALEGLDGRLPVFARFVGLVRARALLTLERYEEAAVAAQLGGDDGIARHALRVRARALREGGAHEAARAAYRSMMGSGYDDEIAVGLLGLARLENEQGHPDRALPLLRRLDLRYPAHWTAAHARRLGEQLADANPALASRWAERGPEERIARAERLLKRHRNKAVVRELEPLTEAALDDALACRQRYALGRAFRKLRRWKKARPRLDEAVVVCARASSELEPWARHVAGKAAERLSDEEGAASLYRAQMARHGDHRLADDAGYKLARHLIEDKHDLKAARKAASDLAKRWPEGDLVPDALFFVATHAMLQKKPKLAREMLDLERKLPARPFDHRDGGRARYWTARLDDKAGRRKKAERGYRMVLSEARLGWYSVLAFSRLREMNLRIGRAAAKAALTTPTVGSPLPGGESRRWSLPVPASLEGEPWERARALARVGLAVPTRLALREAGAGGGDEQLWLNALVLDRAGAYNYSHDILRRQLPQFRDHAPVGTHRKHWELAYPRVFGDLARKYAKPNKLDPHFIWGVIREESGFNAGVESFANAVGLMQLIIPTARQMAKKADGSVNRGRLTEPDLNVRLGARYLAHVRDRTGANTALLPAGYNAGAGALRRWLKARPRVPLDLFVELIPYDEARGYTKRVVASWATYRALYAKTGRDPLPYISQKVQTRRPKKRARPKRRKGKKRRR